MRVTFIHVLRREQKVPTQVLRESPLIEVREPQKQKGSRRILNLEGGRVIRENKTKTRTYATVKQQQCSDARQSQDPAVGGQESEHDQRRRHLLRPRLVYFSGVLCAPFNKR